MRACNSSSDGSLAEMVYFPFDDRAWPLQKGVQLHLNGYRTGCGSTKIVLPKGEEGDPDSEHVAYYGTVIRIEDELWMWYLGQGPDETNRKGNTWFQRVCLAKSKDGYNWEKPNLGVVEYQGNKNNNLVDLVQGSSHVAACVVFYEADDPDPGRRFKMAFQARKYRSQFSVAYSSDGVNWKESPNNPVGPWLEMAGGTKFEGHYQITGQGGKHIPDGGRQFATHISYDFENWSSASCLGLQRTNVVPRPRSFGGAVGEQIHLGAGMWNRGNVIIGFYGMWNGHLSNDRRMTTMDLGLAVSNDALHFREPIPNFPIVSAAEDGWELPPYGHQFLNFPTLIQGQGFENIGEQTLFWFAPWPEQRSDGVRVAVWPRDRLGYFQAYMGGPLASSDMSDPHIVSVPIDLEGKSARLSLNVDRITDYSSVSVEILDERLNPIPGYTHDQCNPPAKSGLKQAISWDGKEIISGLEGLIRVRIDFTGVRPEEVKLFAAYLEETG